MTMADYKAPFKVGDRVAVLNTGGWGSFSHAPKRVQTVKKILKLYLVLDDNTKWKHNGDEHPYVAAYHRHWIEHYTGEHELLIRRERLWLRFQRKIDELKKHCGSMTSEQLEALVRAAEGALVEKSENEGAH
jgi:hypothetical protein